MGVSRNRLRYAVILLLGIAASALATSGRQLAAQAVTTPQYTPQGELRAPVGFESWVFVGSNLGMAYANELAAMTAREATRATRQFFHNVYINPEAYAHFRDTGEFPDPTVLVMETFAAADKEPKGILSAGVFNGDRTGVEVAVKNTRRPDSQSTPWAYYDLTDPADPSKIKPAAAAFPDRACESCHRAHASRDNVWVQFYPTLRKVSK